MTSWQAWKNRICVALFLGVVSMKAAVAVPVLSISASPDPAVQGSPVSLSVLISGITDLYGYNFTLSFNPGVLQATSVTEGSFMPSGGSTFFGGGTIDNSAGTISFIFDTVLGPVPGVSGSGTLANIAFNVINSGISPLTFSDATFLNSSLADISVTLQNRTLQALPIPEPTTFLMFGLGLAGMGALRLRRAV